MGERKQRKQGIEMFKSGKGTSFFHNRWRMRLGSGVPLERKRPSH
jgi:hypothetical protein